jgi:hypothetical protein
MNRRTFLQSTLTAAAATAAARAATTSPARECYELRTYALKPDKQSLLDDYLSKAYIPAVARLGSGPVGVFTETGANTAPLVHVLTVFTSADQILSLPAHLTSDADYQKAAAAYLAVPATDPVYDRIESSILLALEGMPSLVKPDTTAPRIMNLRIYESHNERAALKKLEMFNIGEFAVFQRAKMPMVFCAQTIAGPRMPNLTYMLVFPDDAGRKAGWGRFGKDDPDWKRFRSMHEYDDKEIVSKITNKIVTPASYSQL